MTYKLIIDGCYHGKNRTAPGWNDRIGASARHYQQGAKMERDIRTACGWLIRRQLKGVSIEKPISITYIFHEADKRRDLGNIAFIDKPFEDALQDCKVIPNDNQNYVRELHFLIGEIDKKNPHVEVEIKEIEDG